MKLNYLIVGRFLFDEHDTAQVIKAESESEAVAAWEEKMRTLDTENENDLIQTLIAVSETPINITYYED